MALALFDFDGTITFKDSFADFIKYAVGQTRFRLGVACLTPVFAGFLLGLVPAWRAKELMSIFFSAAGMPTNSRSWRQSTPEKSYPRS